jgi:hypothetical protein
VVAALEQALWDHELVKVKVSSEDRDTRKEQAEALAKRDGRRGGAGAGTHRPAVQGEPGRAAHRALTGGA